MTVSDSTMVEILGALLAIALLLHWLARLHIEDAFDERERQ